MKFLVFIFSTLLLLNSCKEDNFSKKKSLKKTKFLTTKILKNNLLDSLNKFSSLDEFLLKDKNFRYVLYSKEINNTKIGVIAITDTTLYIYRKIKNKWFLNDSISFNTYAQRLNFIDLNGDNRDDLIVYSPENMRGQMEPFVFISDNKDVLHYRPDIKLYNLTYDEENKILNCYSEDLVIGQIFKEKYIWLNDSIKLVEGVEQNLLEKIPTTTFYKLKNGKRYNYKTVIDKNGELFNDAWLIKK